MAAEPGGLLHARRGGQRDDLRSSHALERRGLVERVAVGTRDVYWVATPAGRRALAATR